MLKLIKNDWNKIIEKNFNKDNIDKISTTIINSPNLLPKIENVFRALNECSFKDVKVVILGQDPYPNGKHACGLAFSVPYGITPLPKSLFNMFKELNSDLNINNTNGDLSSWASQGVLLLNTYLTLDNNVTNSHSKIGWEEFTDNIIKTISRDKEKIVFLLMGNNAIKKEKLIDQTKHEIIKTAHPSPLSAYRGFFGSKIFSQINNYLKKTNQNEIDFKT